MKRIWVLEELTDTPYPDWDFEQVSMNIVFNWPTNLTRIFRILSIEEPTIPKMGFDEWW